MRARRIFGGETIAPPGGDDGTASRRIVIELHRVAGDRPLSTVGKHQHPGLVEPRSEVCAADRAVPGYAIGKGSEQPAELAGRAFAPPRIAALAVQIEPPVR